MAAVGLLLVARTVWAADPVVADLSYEVGDALTDCPDLAAFRLAVSHRLGRDPFAVGAARKIRVSLTRNGANLVARVRVEQAGEARGERRIETLGNCAELASGAALAVSIAIDPLAAMQAPSESEPPPEKKEPPSEKPRAAPKPPERRPPPPAPRVRTATPHRAFVHAGVREWTGVLPAPSIGANVGFGYRRSAWSLTLDGMFVPQRSERVAGTPRSVSASVLGAELLPCGHLVGLRACAFGAFGALRARGSGVDQPAAGTSLYAALGASVGYALYLGRFSLTPSVEAGVRLSTSALALDDQTVWTTPRVVGSLGLELGYDVWR